MGNPVDTLLPLLYLIHPPPHTHIIPPYNNAKTDLKEFFLPPFSKKKKKKSRKVRELLYSH